MNTTAPTKPRFQLVNTTKLLFGLIAAALLPLTAFAQSTGTVKGRVYNPAAQSYVGSAEVRLEGTNQVTFTEPDGSFTFNNVAAGPASITVNFSGYSEAKDTFNVTAGQTAVREVNLTSTAATTASKDGIVQLGAFTVSSAREGNSKAIQDQRRDMNIVTTVSADMFGNVMDGNVGEFLKYLPGVDLDYVESEPRGPRLGGMDGQYVGVSIDGMRTASADANRGTGSASRATSFEGFSIANIGSIEINRTSSPENDADSPAGTINMKPRRAFERKGRFFEYNLGANFNSDEFTYHNRVHPGEHGQYQWKPNYNFTYGESFLNQKFGILASVNRGWSITQQNSETMTYNTNSGAQSIAGVNDPRPIVVQQVSFGDGPKWIRKDAMSLNADWKATPRLVLSLNLTYSYFAGDFWNRSFNFAAANSNNNANNGRSTIGGDGLTTIIATRAATGSVNNVANLNWGGGGADKQTWSRQYAPRFDYRIGALAVDGAFGFSESLNHYEALVTGYSTYSEVGSVPSGFIATRPNPQSWEWTIRQTSGPDWFNMQNFTSTDSQVGGTSIQDRTETWRTTKYTGTLNARYPLPFLERFPTVFKFGGKWDEESRLNHNWNPWAKWAYFGPGGNAVQYSPASQTFSVVPGAVSYNMNGQTWTNTGWGSWGNLGPQYTSPLKFESYSTNSFQIYNVNGAAGMPPRPSRTAPADLYHAHPELFVNTANVNDYYNSFIANNLNFRQTMTAAYGQFDTRVTSKLQIRAGVRWEQTKNSFKEYDPLTPGEMFNSSPYASQFTRAQLKDANGQLVFNKDGSPFWGYSPARATSVDGILYQYSKNPQVTRTSKYDNYFPSVLAKYNILSNLEWQLGWNKGISRPAIGNLTGLWSINDNAYPPTVTAPNPTLTPERHEVYQSRLAYYFGGRSPGQLSVAFIQDEATNFISSQTYHDGSALGVNDPQFDGYDFISSRNDPGVHRYRNIDFNYQQTLGFLPSEYLRGLYMGITYSRSYDNQRHVNLVPKRWGFTPSYTYKRFNAGLGIIWTDNKPSSGTYGEYYGAMTRIDARASYRFNNALTLYVSVRNITNVKDEYYRSPPGVQEGKQGLLRNMEEYGANWVFGVRGTF